MIDLITENGVFSWLNRDVNNDAFGVVQDYVYDTDPPALDGLLINRAGVYFISAQVHVRGRHNTLGRYMLLCCLSFRLFIIGYAHTTGV